MPVQIEDFIPEVLINVTGCLDPLIVKYIRSAAKQWCRDTNGWEAALGTFELAPAGTSDTELNGRIALPDDQYSRVRVPVNSTTFSDGWPMQGNTPYGRILAIARVRRQRAGEGRFRTLTSPSPAPGGSSAHVFTKPPYSFEDGILLLEQEVPHEEDGSGPPLQDGDVFEVRATMEPARSDTYLADPVAELADLAIADKAVYELLTIPNQEWTNPALAKDFDQRYLRRLGNQKTRIGQRNTKLPLRRRAPTVLGPLG